MHLRDAICVCERAEVDAVESVKELLQPVIDRSFSTSIANNSNTATSTSSSS